jgi:hypothetical protein
VRTSGIGESPGRPRGVGQWSDEYHFDQIVSRIAENTILS